MRGSQRDIRAILATDGVIARREHPELRGAIAWMVRIGELVPVLPGVYAGPAMAVSVETRIRAVGRWDRDSVLTGAAAARLTFWPSIRVPVISCAVRHHRAPQLGFAFSRRSVPVELVAERSGLRFTRPALTALDLCVSDDGNAIDEVLRTRTATLAQLQRALEMTGDRLGNPQRRRLLLDSRDEPWSVPERRFHRLLRDAGITGWRANLPVRIGDARCYLDVAFELVLLAIEIDGRLYHSAPEAFELDRRRQNLLVLNGWHVLRFTWRMIEEHPDQVIVAVRDALEMLSNRTISLQTRASDQW